MTDTSTLLRGAGLARAIAAIAPKGGVCLMQGEEGDNEVAVATRIAVAIGLDVDYVSTAENEILLRQETTYLGYLAQRRAPMLFVVTDTETDTHDDLIEMLAAIRDASDPVAPWPIAVVTTRDRDDIAVHLSRALDMRFNDIHQA